MALLATSKIVKRKAGELVVKRASKVCESDTLGSDRNLKVKQRGRARFSIAGSFTKHPPGIVPPGNLGSEENSGRHPSYPRHNQQRPPGYDARLKNLENVIACDILPPTITRSERRMYGLSSTHRWLVRSFTKTDSPRSRPAIPLEVESSRVFDGGCVVTAFVQLHHATFTDLQRSLGDQ